jgi:hypothetical protein
MAELLLEIYQVYAAQRNDEGAIVMTMIEFGRFRYYDFGQKARNEQHDWV